jgi:hypothetical protein
MSTSQLLTPRQRDDIQEAVDVSDDDNDDDEMLENNNDMVNFTPIVQPISQDSIAESKNQSRPMPYQASSPKRPRLDAGEATLTPHTTPGRFILEPTNTGRDATTTLSSRPAFLMPPLPAPEVTAPLPDAFSPRRRGQKFVPGGLAAALQTWVIETAHVASQSKARNSEKVEDSVHMIKVDEIEGNDPLFVQGGHTKALLVDGQAKQRGNRVKKGDRVSIRQPTWNVHVLGESWMVGVDWRTMEEA